MSSPLQIYTSKINNGSIKQDILQNEIVLAFEDLYQQLNTNKSSWFFKPKKPFYGLYIFGSVGRGKTFLMDLFVNCIDEKNIRRQHFHQFMLWIHQQLRSIKKQQNPIDGVIKKLSKKIKVLCLDEFLVHDITDAMLLAGILFSLDKYNISLVTTSNVNPVNLYEGGLQRKKFIPAIQWMQTNMRIMQLDGIYDYRTLTHTSHRKWLSPLSDANQNSFEQSFSQLVADDDVHLSEITINKRPLTVIKRSCHHIMFEFETLCQQPRNASDYIGLASQYLSIFIVINSAIEADDSNTARRFITLVDILYDEAIPMYVLSTVDFTEIYLGDALSFEMQRTVSRLTEMQNTI